MIPLAEKAKEGEGNKFHFHANIFYCFTPLTYMAPANTHYSEILQLRVIPLSTPPPLQLTRPVQIFSLRKKDQTANKNNTPHPRQKLPDFSFPPRRRRIPPLKAPQRKMAETTFIAPLENLDNMGTGGVESGFEMEWP